MVQILEQIIKQKEKESISNFLVTVNYMELNQKSHEEPNQSSFEAEQHLI